MKRPLLLACAAVLLGACNVNVDPQFRVKDVRVLAVRSHVLGGTFADPFPGDTVVLDALVANPLARPGLAVDWFVCLPGGTEAVAACSDLATLADPGRLRALAAVRGSPVVELPDHGTTARFLVPALTDAGISKALQLVIRNAVKQPTYRCSLYAPIWVAAFASAGGKQSTATKVVRVKPPSALTDFKATGVENLDQYVRNDNPMMTDLLRAPRPDTCAGGPSIRTAPFPAGRTVICGVEPEVEEQYIACDPSGTTTSSVPDPMSFQWYVTDGDFPKEGGVGNARGNDLEFDRPAGAFTLWSIAHDDRGGADWVTVLVSAL